MAIVTDFVSDGCMATLTPEETGAHFRALLAQAGWTQSGFARALGKNAPSYLQTYVREDRRDYFSADFVEKIEPLLSGRGEPAVTREDVFALAGPVLTRGPALDMTPDLAGMLARIAVLAAAQAGAFPRDHLDEIAANVEYVARQAADAVINDPAALASPAEHRGLIAALAAGLRGKRK